MSLPEVRKYDIGNTYDETALLRPLSPRGKPGYHICGRHQGEATPGPARNLNHYQNSECPAPWLPSMTS
jgi:hypothetical protein